MKTTNKTKVIILGEEPKKYKYIKLLQLLTMDYIIEPVKTSIQAKDWDNIELICRKYSRGKDLMYAYDGDNRSNGVLYIGYFNDGIVEQ